MNNNPTGPLVFFGLIVLMVIFVAYTEYKEREKSPTYKGDLKEYGLNRKVLVVDGYYEGKVGKILKYSAYHVLSAGGFFTDVTYSPDQFLISLDNQEVWIKIDKLELFKKDKKESV